MWGFDRLTQGPGRGGYRHASFVRGQPSLCRHMKRLKIKGTGPKRASSPLAMPSKVQSSPVQSSQQAPRQKISSALLSGAVPLTSAAQYQPAQNTPAARVSVNEGDLFDDGALMEVLSCALDNTNADMAPQDGDCLFFEGRNFFFVEDYNPAADQQQQGQRAPRRLSLEMSYKHMPRASRRFSLERAPAAANASRPRGGRQPRRFSLERAPVTARSSRRFSLEFSSQNQDYVLTPLPC